jgi:hypothetical protein
MVNRSLPSCFFPHQMCFIIWIFFIVLCKIDSYLTHRCSLLKVLNQNLKCYQMDFRFKFLDIHMNEKIITCQDYHGLKWQNINIYPMLNVFLCGLTPFLACWIVTTPKKNGKLWIYVDFHEDGHIQAHVQAKNNLIDQLFKNHFKMLNQGKVDPPIISKVIITNMLGNVIEFIDVYVKIKQWDVIKMCNLYWLQFFTFFQITYQ